MPEKENYINRPAVALGLPKTPNVPFPSTQKGNLSDTKTLSVNDYFTEKMNAVKPKGVADIPISSVYIGNRYDETRPGTNYEEMAGQQQSAWDKLANGVGKMVGTAATSFGSGTLGLVYGALSVPFKGWSSLIDNDVTRSLDNMSKNLENVLPNYYTQTEKDAEWYSPDNILTANFWSDKIIKNLGFSLGALGGGVAWSKLFQAIGVTNKLVQVGRGLETATAVEAAMNTAPNLKKFTAFEGALNSTAGKYLREKAASALVQSDRILTSTMGTFGEASIEGLQSMNQFREKAIEEFREKYGYNPTGDDLERINDFSKKIGMYTWGMNSILLTATNYISLPKILNSSKKAERAIINDVYQETVGDVFQKYTAKTYAGKLISGVRGAGRLLFAPSEAFEEGAQFAIESGVSNYFQRGYDNAENVKSFVKDFNNAVGNVFGEGLEEAISTKEGLESILIGGLSGGMQQAGYIGTYKDEQGNTKFGFGKSGILGEQGLFGLGGEKGINTDIAVSALSKTNIKKVLIDQAKYLGAAMGSQKLRQGAIEANDTFSEKDYENDYLFSYVMPRVKYGKGSSIENELKMYEKQAMDDDGFRELQNEEIVNKNETREQFLSRINKIRNTVKSTEKIYSAISDKYSGSMDDSVIDKLTYAASKIRFYDERIPEINSGIVGIDTQPLVDELLKTGKLTKGAKLSEETIKYIEDQIKETSATDDDIQDKVDLVESLSESVLRRRMFIDDYNDILKSPEKYKEVSKEVVKPEDIAKRPRIKVVTQEGDSEVIVGEEYFAGKRVSVKETEEKVLDITRFKVLEETPEGNIKLQTPDGKIHTVSKKAFEKITLGRVADVDTDNAKFFVETYDHIFTYNKGGGKKVEGRLFYDKTNDSLTFKSFDGKFIKRVTRDQFSPKEGYNVAQIYSNKKFTQIAEQASKEPVSLDEKLATRNQIIADLYDSSKSRLDEINKKLESNKKKLSETVEALDNLSKTKEGIPRKKFTKAIRKTIDTLTKIKSDVETEISQLEVEKEELELMLPYFQDLAQNAQELPEKGGELLSELKEQIGSLEEMIDNTDTAIKSGKSLLKSVESALDNALSLMNDFVRRIKEENPNVPLSVEELQARLEKYQGEEGAKQFISEKLGFTELVMELQDQIDSFGEELKIPDLTKRVESLTEQIKELELGIDGLIVEQMAKQKVLDTLEEYAERIKKQKEEEAKLKKNQELRTQLLGTNSNDVANNVSESKTYQQESKKDDLAVVGSTMAPSYKDAEKPFNQRANRFGFRFNSLENRDDIKGIIVTANTEDQLIPGLIYSNREEKKLGLLTEGMNTEVYNPDNVIALVMVQDNGDGTFTPVDEFGAPIPEGANLLDLAVFQVFPDSKLTANYDGQTQTMFRDRDTTLDYVEKALREQYTQWRTERLKETELGEPKSISASFGIPKYVTYKNAKGKEETDHDARTSAEDAGLITFADLAEKHLITVATNNDAVSNGSVTFNTPLGRVFLKVPGGMAKLFNTKFSKKKATLIYDVIHQLAKNSLEDGSVKTDKSQRLMTWLKSVVYWGIPKNLQTGERKEAKFNSVFFEDVPTADGTTETRLFISGRGASFEFSPTGLEQNKGVIIALLEGMYHNANATSLNAEGKFKQPYFEIVGLDKEGNPIFKEWKNYQSYLLSDKDADGKKRTGADIPLTTKFRPLKGEGDVNREGIYFTLNDTIDDYIIPQKPVVKSAPAPQVQQAPPAQPATNSYKLDGTMETMTLGTFGDVKFSIKGDVFAEIMKKQIEETGKPFEVTVDVQKELIDRGALNFEIPETVEDAVDKAKGKGKDFARAVIVTSIIKKASASVKIDVPSTGIVSTPTAPVVTPAPTAPVSDKKAEKPVINIYWGSPESSTNTRVLSNLAPRKFTYKGREYGSVEHAYQSNKSGTFDESNYNAYNNLKEIPGKQGPGYGTKIRGKAVTAGFDNLQLMRDLVVESFKQNPEQAKLLLNYSDFTHTTNEVIDKAFLDGVRLAQKNAELAALEGAKPVVTPTGGAFANRKKGNNVDNEAYRLKLAEEANKFEGENWTKLEQWLKKNFPNLPVYRVKNVLRTTNGLQAWGKFRDGAIYIYQNAEVGTAYHEVFEAVWKMFADADERVSVLKEFRARKGSYTDVFTGKKVEYANATDQEIKEQLAEEFRDYVLTGKIPAKPTVGKPFILKLFADLVSFIKEFFTGVKAQTNTANLFAKIGNGYYKDYIPFETNLSYAKTGIIDIEDAPPTAEDEYRLDKVPGVQRGEIMQQMTYNLLSTLTKTNQSIFQISEQKLSEKETYEALKESVLSILGNKADLYDRSFNNREITAQEHAAKVEPIAKLYNEVHDNWEEFIEEHKEYLKPYGIEFDENEDLILKDEDKTKEVDHDARKIDGFKKTNAAIKMLFATVPISRIVDGKPDIVPNTIGGVTLLPADKVFITLKNELYNAVNLDDMLEKFRKFALGNPNYWSLYRRITKNLPTETDKYSKLNAKHDWQLMGGFWKAMKGQNPDVRTVFILPTGDVVIGDSNLSSAAAQAKYDFMNDIISTIRDNKNKYVSYNTGNQTFNVTTLISKVQLDPKRLETYTQFLENMGVSFDPKVIKRLKDDKKAVFIDAVNGIRDSVSKYKDIKSLTKKTLDIDKRLMQLGTVQAVIENPDFESTYFNLNGERVQTYLNPNALSSLHDVISKAKNISELASTQYGYLLTDAFLRSIKNGNPIAGGGSLILRRIFNIDGKGSRIANTQDILHTAYVDGTVNEEKGRNKESSKVNQKERLIQELNLNLDGYYLNLVPGDASIEHAVYLHEKENPFISEETIAATGLDKVVEIFRDYFISEVELAKDDRKIVQNVEKDRDSKDLRFFKDILGESLHKKIKSQLLKKSSEKLYEDNKVDIDRAIENFILQDVKDRERTLRQYGIVYNSEEGLVVENLEFAEKESFTQEDLTRNLKMLSANYMIANIELHKLLYSDPYQYKDELKRIKSFNSPRQTLMDSDDVNVALEKTYNEGYEPGDAGYTEMSRNYLNSTAIDDVFSTDDLYKDAFEETDGGGYISDKANRWVRIKAGNWNDAEEEQYRYDIAYYKLVRKPEQLTKEEKKKYKIEDPSTLSKEKAAEQFSKFLKLNPAVRSVYTTLKPIVSGNKDDGNNYNDIVLDKFALVPLSFRVLHQLNPNSNAVRFVEKMMDQKLDYGVYNTGRKVGNTTSTPLYNQDGSFNTEPFREINRIPFSIMGIQTEVPSKEEEVVTQGSQVTKLVTMDFMEAGVPIDFEPGGDINDRFIKWMALSEQEKEKSDIYRRVKENKEILEERIQNNYKSLLKKLGIVQTEEGFKLDNPKKLIDSLTDEILKRDVNANIFAAFKGYEKGQVVLEATPAYQQIRYVLFSIADKTVISPKIKGSQKVQIPATLLEDNKVEAKDVNGKMAYTSDTLNFYRDEDGKRVCEIMVGRWFDNSFTEGMTDEELLKYLNSSKEGQKILNGIAFRIPTQKQNSIDAFRIKQFLPKEFGDNVVVPSALVKKVGSDFDIDKLSIYFKNTFSGIGGKLQIVPFYGFGEQAKEKFKDLYYEILQSKIDRKEAKKISVNNLQNLFGDLSIGRSSDKVVAKWIPIFKEMFADDLIDGQIPVRVVEEFFIDKLESLQKSIDTLTDFDIQEVLANEFKEKKYKESLENAYVESLEGLVSHPLNFKNLVKANSADQMKQITKDILNETKEEQFNYSSVGNMLKINFMSKLRHAFVTGKYAIGIAAIAQTNHAQNQRGPIFINTDLLETDSISVTDKKFLGDGQFNFEEYNSIMVNGKKRPTLSLIKDASKEEDKKNSISDIIGQFIDGYVDISKGPWIMQLKAFPNVASTWLFLIKTGVPVRTVAYFMNQPIISDFLRTLDASGYSWLFNDRIVGDIMDIYSPQSSDIAEPTKIPSEDALLKMLKYNQSELKGKMNDTQKVQQQFVLREFLKYAKMAEHLLSVTQGSNFDTATINDPFIIFKKRLQLIKARMTIFSSLNDENETIPAVDDILDESFIGKLKDVIFDIRDAFATFLISDKVSDDPTRSSTREVLEAVLLPYIGENDRDFVKIARKAVNDLFDWAVQTNRQINTQIETILLGKDGKASAAKEVMEFVKAVKQDSNHPLFNNVLINSFKLRPGSKQGVPDNLEIVGKGNKAYDQNQIIFAFNELLSYMKETNPQLRGKLLRLAVLQSGLSTSPISFTTLLPYEDFLAIYNETLSVIDKMPNLAEFYRTSVFQRSNARNGDIVPFSKAKLKESKKTPGRWYNPAQWFVNERLKKAMQKGDIPDVFVFSTMSREGANDFITYSWENKISKAQKAKARRTGNRDHVNTALLKKVYKADGTPLIQQSESGGVIYESFVYKAVNAWGDSIRGKEFYEKLNPVDASSTVSRASVLDNGFNKVKEVEDGVIENIVEGGNAQLTPGAPQVTAPTQPAVSIVQNPQYEGLTEFNKLPGRSSTRTMTYAGIGSRNTPPEVLAQMTEVARELSATYTLNTGVTFGGKKEGADKAFDDGATKKNLFSPENQGSRSREQAIAKEIHPNPSALSPGAMKLMARNTNQVFGDNLNTPVDFVLFYAEETDNPLRPKGGTGQAVEMARRKGIPTINMANPNWRQELNRVLSGGTQPTVSGVKPTIDLSKEWKGDLKTRPVYTAEGVNTMRTEVAKPNEHFGNPFSEAGYGDTIKVDTIGEAVVNYKDWLLGNKFQNVKPEQRTWILNQINQGKLDGATLLYAGKSEARGQGMHPTALVEVVEQLRGRQAVSSPSAKNMKLKDGVTYGFSAINAKMLEAMGYTPQEIGQILKSIC